MACAVLAFGCRSAPPAAPVATTTPGPHPAPEPAGNVKVVTETQIEILDPIKFVPGSATLEITSIPMIEAIALTLTGNPSIRRVAVQAFGADALASLQERLGTTRAQTIVAELIARGVEPRRLIAEGLAQPPAGVPNEPVFLILERAP